MWHWTQSRGHICKQNMVPAHKLLRIYKGSQIHEKLPEVLCEVLYGNEDKEYLIVRRIELTYVKCFN